MNDLQEMSDYITNVLYNPQAAARIKKSILDSCGRLKDQPLLGPSVQEKNRLRNRHALSCMRKASGFLPR